MDGYSQIKQIGRGTFGDVFAVRREADGSEFVMKCVKVDNMQQKEQQLALQEVQLLRKMNHPHIIGYQESALNRSQLCIVMEWARGGDVQTYVQKRKAQRLKIEEDQVVSWMVQATMALEYIHGLQILHRDLKPGNLFLTENGQLKLGDFGVSRVLSGAHANAMTRIGTPFYLSPEQCSNMPYNHKSDIWSLGVIMYELMMLRPPFDPGANGSMMDMMKLIRNKQPPPLPTNYSRELRSQVEQMLSKAACARPDASQILAYNFFAPWVRKLRTSASSASSSPSTKSTSPKERRESRGKENTGFNRQDGRHRDRRDRKSTASTSSHPSSHPSSRPGKEDQAASLIQEQYRISHGRLPMIPESKQQRHRHRDQYGFDRHSRMPR